MTGVMVDGRGYAHCTDCGWFDTYRTPELAQEKLATHHNYIHAGFACPGAAR